MFRAHPYLHFLTHSFPTRRSSGLGWLISCFSKCTPGLARECFEAYESVPAFPSDPYNMRQTMTDPFRVPLIIRGEIIDDGEIDHGGRRGGVSFQAPDISKYVAKLDRKSTRLNSSH